MCSVGSCSMVLTNLDPKHNAMRSFRRVINSLTIIFAVLTSLLALTFLTLGVLSYSRVMNFEWGSTQDRVTDQAGDCVKMTMVPATDWIHGAPSYEESLIHVSTRIDAGKFSILFHKVYPCTYSNIVSCPICGTQIPVNTMSFECKTCRDSALKLRIPGFLEVTDATELSWFQRILLVGFPFHTPLFLATIVSGLLWISSFRQVFIPHRRRRRGQCTKCGYSLQGSVSSHCAECGEPIR